VIAQLVNVEIVAPDPGAERRDQGADFLAGQHLVEARPLDVQDRCAICQPRGFAGWRKVIVKEVTVAERTTLWVTALFQSVTNRRSSGKSL
jgi:hypothetical protein